MTRDEGVAMIKEQLGFRTTLDSSIVNYMLLAQVTLEKAPTKPWFLVSEDTFTSTVANEERVPVPLDFLCETDDAALRYRPDSYPDLPERELKKEDYDVLREIFRCTENGKPRGYALIGNYFRIAPVPDAVYNLRQLYYKKGTLLSSNIENEWLKEVPLLLLGSAGKLISGPTRDVRASNVFDGWIATGTAILHNHDSSRASANRNDQIGGKHW